MITSGFTVSITEIMASPAAGGDFEFIEFKNVGDEPADLRDVEVHVDRTSSLLFPVCPT